MKTKYRTASFPNDTGVQEWPCPHCGSPNDRAAEATGEKTAPKAGDLIVCYNCGGFCEFDDLGLTKKLTPEEFERLSQTHKDILNLMRAAIYVRNELRSGS